VYKKTDDDNDDEDKEDAVPKDTWLETKQ